MHNFQHATIDFDIFALEYLRASLNHSIACLSRQGQLGYEADDPDLRELRSCGRSLQGFINLRDTVDSALLRIAKS